jgi:hypothetical protein
MKGLSGECNSLMEYSVMSSRKKAIIITSFARSVRVLRIFIWTMISTPWRVGLKRKIASAFLITCWIFMGCVGSVNEVRTAYNSPPAPSLSERG